MSGEDEENGLTEEEKQDETATPLEKRWSIVALTLTLAFENLASIDLQALASLDKGLSSFQIRNLSEFCNRAFSIIKHNPIQVGDKETTMIDEAKLKKFNGYVRDFMMLETLMSRLENPERIIGNEDKWYYEFIIPKYKKQVDKMLKEDGISQTWEDIGYYDDMTLDTFLRSKIFELGYDLYGEVMLTLSQTLPKNELERISRSLRFRRSTPEWVT